MVAVINAKTPLLKLVAAGGILAGVLFAIFGVVLVFSGDAGPTKFVLFGQQFQSTSVGISAIAIGAITVVFVIRATLKSLDSSDGEGRALEGVSAPAVRAASETEAPVPSSPPPDTSKLMDDWINRVLSLHEEKTGGFRGKPEDLTGANVHQTAQAVTGVLAAFRKRGVIHDFGAAERDRRVRAALEFLEARRGSERAEGWGDIGTRNCALTVVVAWVIQAEVRASDSWPEADIEILRTRLRSNLDLLLATRDEDGGWCPIPPVKSRNTRTYVSIVAIWALVELEQSPRVSGCLSDTHRQAMLEGLRWLLAGWTKGAGWIENRNRGSTHPTLYPALTSQAVYVLSRAALRHKDVLDVQRFRAARLDFLELFRTRFAARRIDENEQIDSLDQYMDDGGQIGGSSFLWLPWSILAAGALANDRDLAAGERAKAAALHERLLGKVAEMEPYLGDKGIWEVGEFLLCLAEST